MAAKRRKQLILNIESADERVRAWLTLVSGVREFTTREIDVLEVIILKREELVANQIKDKNLSELLFSTSNRKEYIKKLGITEYNFTNILSSIKKKGGIRLSKGGFEDIDINLIPSDEILIKFRVKNDK